MKKFRSKRLTLIVLTFFFSISALALLYIPSYLARTNQDIRQQASTTSDSVIISIPKRELSLAPAKNYIPIHFNTQSNKVKDIRLQFYITNVRESLFDISLKHPQYTFTDKSIEKISNNKFLVTTLVTPIENNASIHSGNSAPLLELELTPSGNVTIEFLPENSSITAESELNLVINPLTYTFEYQSTIKKTEITYNVPNPLVLNEMNPVYVMANTQGEPIKSMALDFEFRGADVEIGTSHSYGSIFNFTFTPQIDTSTPLYTRVSAQFMPSNPKPGYVITTEPQAFFLLYVKPTTLEPLTIELSSISSNAIRYLDNNNSYHTNILALLPHPTIPVVAASHQPPVSCNSICVSNDDCAALGPNYSCLDPNGTGKQCRLTNFPDSDSCQMASLNPELPEERGVFKIFGFDKSSPQTQEEFALKYGDSLTTFFTQSLHQEINLPKGQHTFEVVLSGAQKEKGWKVESVLCSDTGVETTASTFTVEVGSETFCSINMIDPVETSPQPETVSADVNKDQEINIFDYNILVSEILEPSNNSPADLNLDKSVNLLDYSIFREKYLEFNNQESN